MGGSDVSDGWIQGTCPILLHPFQTLHHKHLNTKALKYSVKDLSIENIVEDIAII